MDDCVFLFGISSFVLEIFTLLYYTNEERMTLHIYTVVMFPSTSSREVSELEGKQN